MTKERIIVLDSGGGGVGSLATVKSNHHLTELIKLTFKKKDPELLTLFVANSLIGMGDGDIDETDNLDQKSRGGKVPLPSKAKQYRVTKRDELVDVLQVVIKINICCLLILSKLERHSLLFQKYMKRFK